MKPSNQNNAKKLKKAQKKALKAVANNSLTHKNPSQASKPGKAVAKNNVAYLRDQLINQHLVKILLSVMAPKEYPSIRLGSSLGAYQTAVANPFAVDPVSWINTSSNAVGDSSTAFVFRDPFRFCITTKYFDPATSPWYYRTTVPGITFNGNWTALQFGPLGWFSGDKPHGDWLYPGRMGGMGRTYIWMNPGDQITFLNSTPVNTAIVRPYYFRPDGYLEGGVQFTVPAAGTTPFVLPPSSAQGVGAYVGFDLNSPTNNVTYSMQLELSNQGGGGRCYAHKALPWIDSNYRSAEAIKIYGASLMFTNVASPLNRQGKLAAAQLPEGRDWRTALNYDTVASVKDAYVNNAVNGYYGFLKPTQPKDLDFKDNWTSNGGGSASQITMAWFEMQNPSDCLVVSVKVTDPDGRDAYVTCAAAVEYRTDDQWREVKQPSIPYSSVFEAMNIVARAPQHHENPFHIGDIFGWIGEQVSGLWNGIKEAYPKVMDGLNTAVKIGTLAAPLMML